MVAHSSEQPKTLVLLENPWQSKHMRSPELIFQQILDRIISSRRVTRYDRMTLLAIARSEFVPTSLELQRVEKIFKHLNLGLIKVVD